MEKFPEIGGTNLIDGRDISNERPINGKRTINDDSIDRDSWDMTNSKKIRVDYNGVDHIKSPANGDLNKMSSHINGRTTDVHTSSDKTDHSSFGLNDKLKGESFVRNDPEKYRSKDISSNHVKTESYQSKTSQSDGEPELITLSDSDDEFKELRISNQRLFLSDPATLKLLKRHQDKLRMEESKLMLLKKLRVSLSKTYHASTLISNKGSEARDLSSSAASSHKSSDAGNVPPPLKRGMNQTSTTHHIQSNKASGQQPSGQSISHSQAKTAASQSQLHNVPGSSSGPPPLVNMSKTSSNQAAANGSQVGNSTQFNAAPKKHVPAVPQMTTEQKLASAKLALRKQLEQTLLQIPTPKPLPPEVNFLPSLNSAEFVYLLGMEEVVKYILSADQKDIKYVFNPFTCVQCNTDFTPVWKRDKPGSKNVICEKCITTNQKKLMKQEHTSKLKAAFSKAALKEQDLERRIAAGSPVSDIPGISTSSAVSTPSTQVQTPTAAASATSSLPQLAAVAAQQSLSHMSSVSPNHIAQLQQHALLQAQAEQMRAMLAAQAMALPYPLYGVSSKQASDIQRQYLLDMINPRSWKT